MASPALQLEPEIPVRDDSLDVRGIQRAARLAAIESAWIPLPVGRQVAWAVSRGMQGTHTDDFSLVHRAGPTTEPTDDGQLALCGERIAHAVRRVPLSPRLAIALGICRYCEEDYARFLTKPEGQP